MRRNQKVWAIYSSNLRRPKIILQPQYQRGPTWSLSQRQRFIDSILRDFDIPKFYMRVLNESGDEWEVVDGQQRLTSIWNFLDNSFALMVESDAVKGHETSGKHYNDLHADVQEVLLGYELNVVELEADNQEVEEMFLRLQDGDPLNSPEKRNAIFGNMRDFVNETASRHKLFTSVVPIINNRFAHYDIVSKLLRVEIRGGPTSLRHIELKEMYEKGRTFNKNSSDARAFKKILNFLEKSFAGHGSHLTLLNLISLYTVASELIANYSFTARRASDFRNWFIDFEERRTRRRQSSSGTEDDRDIDFEAYELALVQQTASISSQRTRRNTLMQDFLASTPDLVLRDPQRQFNPDQRYAIYVRAKGKCSNPYGNPECPNHCAWDSFHADHIIPHSEGGKTTVSNGQLLCPSCNHKKSAKLPVSRTEQSTC